MDSYSCSVNCEIQSAAALVETVVATRSDETVVTREKTRKLPGMDYWGKSTSRGLIGLSLCSYSSLAVLSVLCADLFVRL